MVNYNEYIISDEWKQKSAIFIKSVGSCENCGRTKKLGCHHKTYKNLGKETKKDILVWCWDCHKYYHEKYTIKHHKPHHEYNGIRECDMDHFKPQIDETMLGRRFTKKEKGKKKKMQNRSKIRKRIKIRQYIYKNAI